MAMSGGSSGGMLSEINVTPLVDVMLVLLVIFMVAAPMLTTGVEVALPQARAQVIDNEEGKLVVTITDEQEIFLGESRIGSCPGTLPADEPAIAKCIDGVLVTLEANEKLRIDRELYLHADQRLPYGFVVKVMAAAKNAGADKLGMVTDPLK